MFVLVVRAVAQRLMPHERLNLVQSIPQERGSHRNLQDVSDRMFLRLKYHRSGSWDQYFCDAAWHNRHGSACGSSATSTAKPASQALPAKLLMPRDCIELDSVNLQPTDVYRTSQSATQSGVLLSSSSQHSYLNTTIFPFPCPRGQTRFRHVITCATMCPATYNVTWSLQSYGTVKQDGRNANLKLVQVYLRILKNDVDIQGYCVCKNVLFSVVLFYCEKPSSSMSLKYFCLIKIVPQKLVKIIVHLPDGISPSFVSSLCNKQ